MRVNVFKTVNCFIILLLFIPISVNYADNIPGKTLEYSVISIEPSSWIVTAKEVATGNIVKFHLPPSTFKGKTFDADLKNVKMGQPFAARSSRNVQFNKLQVTSDSSFNEKNRYKHNTSKNRQIPGKFPKTMPAPQTLNWVIINVNAIDWVVTAKSSKTGEIISFQADPNGFRGFKFKGNISKIRQGEGFTLVTSESREFKNSLKLLKRSRKSEN